MTTENPKMQKRMKIMLLIVGILFGAIFCYKTFNNLMMKYFMSHRSQTVTVSTMKVAYSPWNPKLTASGSLRAVRGVNVTTELAGMVQTIFFTPGAVVAQDTVLVQLNASSDIGLLQSLQANAELAKITYTRDSLQYMAKAISKETLDTDELNLKSLNAQVMQQAATVAKKTIRAPFTGRLGISAVNPGQYLNAGDKVVTLQQLDPIYVDFYVPQQQLPQLKIDQTITMTVDAFPGKVFSGKITTIDPLIDVNTRNAEIEATVSNPTLELYPGMFANVEVITGTPEPYLTLPQTAVSYNPYGDIVFLIQKTGKGRKAALTVTQNFVKTGALRGDQVQILDGIKEGDEIVTSGQMKLKNGTQVVINNSVVPANNPAPNLSNEH